MTTSECCSGEVGYDRWGQSAQCLRQATCIEDGKPYCKTHAPSQIAKRRAVLQAAWDAKYEAVKNKARLEAKDRRKLAVYDGLVAALTMLKAHADLFGAFRDDVGQTVLGEVNATLARALEKGGKQ